MRNLKSEGHYVIDCSTTIRIVFVSGLLVNKGFMSKIVIKDGPETLSVREFFNTAVRLLNDVFVNS